jgi:hypothetical protein
VFAWHNDSRTPSSGPSHMAGAPTHSAPFHGVSSWGSATCTAHAAGWVPAWTSPQHAATPQTAPFGARHVPSLFRQPLHSRRQQPWPQRAPQAAQKPKVVEYVDLDSISSENDEEPRRQTAARSEDMSAQHAAAESRAPAEQHRPHHEESKQEGTHGMGEIAQRTAFAVRPSSARDVVLQQDMREDEGTSCG